MWLAKALTIGMAIAAQVLKQTPDQAAKDRAALQGSWEVVSSVSNGQSGTAVYRNWVLTFEGDMLSMTDGFTGPGPAKFTLDAKSTPRSIDLQQVELDQFLKGIYSLEGDSLRVCLSFDEHRPREFKSNVGDKSNFFVLKRQE